MASFVANPGIRKKKADSKLEFFSQVIYILPYMVCLAPFCAKLHQFMRQSTPHGISCQSNTGSLGCKIYFNNVFVPFPSKKGIKRPISM